MIKEPFCEDKEIYSIREGHILWDDLCFGVNEPHEITFGLFYIIREVHKHVLDDYETWSIMFNRYTREMKPMGPASVPLVLFETKHQNRIYKVKFESPDEEAKFRLQI